MDSRMHLGAHPMAAKKKRRPAGAAAVNYMVEIRGFEPLTS